MNNDLISRSALLEALDKKLEEYEESDCVPSLCSAIRIVKEQPAIDISNVNADLKE